jgi:hypothetical protein
MEVLSGRSRLLVYEERIRSLRAGKGGNELRSGI